MTSCPYQAKKKSTKYLLSGSLLLSTVLPSCSTPRTDTMIPQSGPGSTLPAPPVVRHFTTMPTSTVTVRATSTTAALEFSLDSLSTLDPTEYFLPVFTPEELVRLLFEPADHDWALRIMFCESSNRPNALNPTSSASGLFQHLPKFWAERTVKANAAGYFNNGDIFDPLDNVTVAAWLYYEGGGARHWECK